MENLKKSIDEMLNEELFKIVISNKANKDLKSYVLFSDHAATCL